MLENLATFQHLDNASVEDVDWVAIGDALAVELDITSRNGAQIGMQQDRKSTPSELQSLMRISYAVFCLKKKKTQKTENNNTETYRTESNIKKKKKVHNI